VQKEMTPARARRKAVGRLIQKIQHAVPGVVLIQHGVDAFRHGAGGSHLVLAVAEIATSVAVFISLAAALRALAIHVKARTVPHLHLGTDWTDIFLGLMLFTEVASRYPVTHKLWSPTMLLGIVMIVLGFFGGHIVRWKTGHGVFPYRVRPTN
jgi:hypothetical protein